jgi:hypothetical protein
VAEPEVELVVEELVVEELVVEELVVEELVVELDAGSGISSMSSSKPPLIPSSRTLRR